MNTTADKQTPLGKNRNKIKKESKKEEVFKLNISVE